MSEDNDSPSPNKDAAPLMRSVELPVIDLLERLGRGDTLQAAMAALGLAEEDTQSCFRQAARTVRSVTLNAKQPALAMAEPQPQLPSKAWERLTVVEALEILAAVATNTPARDK